MEKRIFDIKETAEYLGVGVTKAREIVANNEQRLRVFLPNVNRILVDKNRLDEWLTECCMVQ